MALKRTVEDLVLLATALFAFTYPFLTSLLILKQERQKELSAKSYLEETARLLSLPRCGGKLPLLKARLSPLLVPPEKLESLCGKLPPPEERSFSKEEDLYLLKLKGKGFSLTLAGRWEGEKFKLVALEHEEGR